MNINLNEYIFEVNILISINIFFTLSCVAYIVYLINYIINFIYEEIERTIIVHLYFKRGCEIVSESIVVQSTYQQLGKTFDSDKK